MAQPGWSTRTTTPSSACRGRRRRPRSRRPSASWPASTIRTPSPATPPPSGGSRRSTRPTRSSATRRSASSTTSSAPTGRRSARARAGRRRTPGGGPFAGFGGPGGNVRYEFHTTGDPGEFSDFFRVFFGEDAGGEVHAGVPGRAAGPVRRRSGLRGDPGRDGSRRRRGSGPPAAAARPARPQPRPAAEAHAEISLDEAYHGTTRLVEVDGKRLEVTIPPGADTGTRIRLTGKAPGGGDLFVVVRQLPDARFTRRGADLERELPLTPRGGAARRRGPGRDAQGQRPAEDPGRHPERPHLPADRPGHAQVQGQRPRRPVRQGQGRPADQPVGRGEARPRAASSSSPTNPTRADAPDPTERDRHATRTLHPEGPGGDRRRPGHRPAARQPGPGRRAHPVRARRARRRRPRRDAAPARRRPARVPRRAGGHPGQARPDPGRLARRSIRAPGA